MKYIGPADEACVDRHPNRAPVFFHRVRHQRRIYENLPPARRQVFEGQEIKEGIVPINRPGRARAGHKREEKEIASVGARSKSYSRTRFDEGRPAGCRMCLR